MHFSGNEKTQKFRKFQCFYINVLYIANLDFLSLNGVLLLVLVVFLGVRGDPSFETWNFLSNSELILGIFASSFNLTRQVCLFEVTWHIINISMPSKATRIYKHANKITRDESGVPTYDPNGENIKCMGLHKTMKSKFYPWREWKLVSKRTGSSKKKGIMIHNQLRHYYS